MRIWLAVGLALFLGIGVGVGTAVVRVNRYPWVGTLEAVQAGAHRVVRPKGSPPEVFLEEETYDFGVMDNNSAGQHEFVFANVGQGPLRLEQGATSCKCTATIVQHGEIAPGESATVIVEWTAQDSSGDFLHTAQIGTNDPNRPMVTLTIKGRITVAVRAIPSQVIFTGITAGQSRSAEVRLFGFLSDPLEITGCELAESSISENFDVSFEPLPSDQLTEQRDATSGWLVKVTAKPGLPVGAFQQKISLKTNYPEVPKVELFVRGTVSGEISIVGNGWDRRNDCLRWGSVKSEEGGERKLFIRVGGPHSKEVSVKPVEIYPDFLNVQVGDAKYAEGSNIALIPLIVQIPKGSRPADHLGSDREQQGRIVLETSHPQAPELRIFVRFAVEG